MQEGKRPRNWQIPPHHRELEHPTKTRPRMRDLVEKSFPDSNRTFIARLEGRMAINLAEGIIENAGISLDRIFGEPMIPASALKGIARNAALWDVRRAKDPEEKKTKMNLLAAVFGFRRSVQEESDFAWALNQEELFKSVVDELKDSLPKGIDAKQGGVSFLPAHPVSEDAEVVVDLTNVHCPKYYGSKNMRDLAEEKPRPNPFPVVEAGAAFSFLMVRNELGSRSPLSGKLLEAAQDWLKSALVNNGAGAKTAAGYGWFSIVEGEDPMAKQLEEQRALAEAKAKEQEAMRQKEAKEKERLESLSPVDRHADEFAKMEQQQFAEALKSLEDAEEERQRGYFQILLSAEKKTTLKNWIKKKPKNKEIIEKLCSALGIDIQ